MLLLRQTALGWCRSSGIIRRPGSELEELHCHSLLPDSLTLQLFCQVFYGDGESVEAPSEGVDGGEHGLLIISDLLRSSCVALTLRVQDKHQLTQSILDVRRGRRFIPG